MFLTTASTGHCYCHKTCFSLRSASFAPIDAMPVKQMLDGRASRAKGIKMKKRMLVFLFLTANFISLYAWGPQPQFLIGKEYYICDEPINVRSEFGLSGQKIDTIYIGEKIKVLEYGPHEALDGNYEYSWCKIEYKTNKTGWIYGKYIAIKTVICDIDSNGLLDYVFFRYVNEHMFYSFKLSEDIIIYQNGEKMNFPIFLNYTLKLSHADFYASKNKDKVLITVKDGYAGFVDMDTPVSNDTSLMMYLLSKDGLSYIKNIDENRSTMKIRNDAMYGELQEEYVIPILGSDYSYTE